MTTEQQEHRLRSLRHLYHQLDDAIARNRLDDIRGLWWQVWRLGQTAFDLMDPPPLMIDVFGQPTPAAVTPDIVVT